MKGQKVGNGVLIVGQAENIDAKNREYDIWRIKAPEMLFEPQRDFYQISEATMDETARKRLDMRFGHEVGINQ